MTTTALKFILATCLAALTGESFAQNPCQPPIPPTVLLPITLCAEEAPYTLPWGPQVAVSGTYSTTLVAASGCDSVVKQTVTIRPAIRTILGVRDACAKECLTVCGEKFCEAGTYQQVCTSFLGCDSTITFTLAPLGVPSGGVVFDDLNGNGMQEANEPDLAGVEVHAASGQVEITNAQGKYKFASLNVFDTLFVPNPPHNSPGTLPNFFAYYANPSGSSGCIDFAVLPGPGTATGLVFMDFNADGIFNAGDKALNMIAVNATGQAQQLTGPTGQYVFSGLQNGDTIAVALPANASASSPVWYIYDDTQLYNYDFAISPGNTPASGLVFWDYNLNGIQEGNEPVIPGIQVFTSSGALTVTDSLGKFFFSGLPDGDTIRVVPPAPPSVSIPGFRAHVFDNNGLYRFGITPSAAQYDLSVNLGATPPFRPGFSTKVVVTVQNLIAQTDDVALKLLLPDFLQVQNISLPPTSMLGDTLYWDLQTLDAGQTISITLTVLTPAGTPLGTAVNSYAWVTPIQGDFYPDNNATVLKRQVVGAYDPNDKQVTPAYLLPDEAELRPSLVYTVRFQNTGNYPADFVIIRDTLSDDLDLASFRFIGASHPCTWEILPGKILVVHFADINLPDSLSNEPESHGIVRFSIRPRAAFPLGHTVENTASIYFDFNDPIQTNTATTQVVYFLPGDGAPPETGAMIVRPNPASWTFYAAWKNPAPEGSILRLLDLRGLPFLQLNLDAGQTNAAIDVSYIPEGVYLLVLEGPGLVLRKKVVVLREGPPRRN